jgi:hypothetical protein
MAGPVKKKPRKPKPVEIRIGRRVDGGAIRYVLSQHRSIAMAGASLWAVTVFAVLTDREAVPWWLVLVPVPLLVAGLHRSGIDVRPEAEEIVIWRWFLIRYSSRTVPLCFPAVDSREVDIGPATESLGTRRTTTLHFGPVSLKDVSRKNLGRFLGELRWIVAERDASRGDASVDGEG